MAKTADIVLINPTPPFFEARDFTADAPPLGLLSLASFLHANRVKARIIDAATFADWDLFFSALLPAAKQAGLAGITFQAGMEMQVKRIVEFLQREAPKAKILLGGWQPTLKDCGPKMRGVKCITGVGGEAYSKLLAEIRGANAQGGKRETAGAVPVDYEISKFGLDWERYTYPKHKQGVVKGYAGLPDLERREAIAALEKEAESVHVPLYISHTCPAHLAGKGCRFCDIAGNVPCDGLAQRVSRERARLFREIGCIGHVLKGRTLAVEFNAEATNFALWSALISEFKKNGLNVHEFIFQTRADMLSAEWIKAMKESEMPGIAQIGFEYGNQSELDYVGKGTAVSQYLALLPRLAGLKFVGFFILTSAVSTAGTLKQNIEFIEKVLASGGQTLVNPAIIDTTNPKGGLFSETCYSLPRISDSEKAEMLALLKGNIKRHEKMLKEAAQDNWKARGIFSLMRAEEELEKILG
ncbi:MAG: hypothetical protein ABH854_04295 [Candidatus Diapherotrites archaeon]